MGPLAERPTFISTPSTTGAVKTNYIGITASMAFFVLAGCGGSNGSAVALEPHEFAQTNLISDQPNAVVQDPDMINPWSIASSANGPFWVTNNRTGKATIYNTAGAKQALVVNIAGNGNNANAPVTGEVFNTTPSFVIPGAARAQFIFSTQDGVISAWSGGTSSVVVANRSGNGAAYTGLALGTSGGNNFLFAANFLGNSVDVFGADFGFVKSFTDPNVPAGFAPFGIRNIDGNLFVTFAKPGPGGVDAAPGNGFVDVFNTDGTMITRLVSRGHLNAPWGLVKVPNGFGGFSNALFVGNFGDGQINAFDITSGKALGVVADTNGKAIKNSGLWDLAFGNGIAGGTTDKLYFTAGIGGETHGLFGFLTAVAPAN